MTDNGFSRDTITLRSKEMEVKTGFIPQADLTFYPENPRVYSIVSADDREPSQDEIETALTGREHVKKLVHSIKANGGLTDPLLVREGDLVVLEGNSRLAAYRLLFARDPLKWGKVKRGTAIMIAVAGDEIRDVSKLQKYLRQGASSMFEAFLKGAPGKALALF